MDESVRKTLGFGMTFHDLYDHGRLKDLDDCFLVFLESRDKGLRDGLCAARRIVSRGGSLEDESSLLLALAPHLEDFIASLFSIEEAVESLRVRHGVSDPIHRCRRLFVQRRALKAYGKAEDVADYDGERGRGVLAQAFGEDMCDMSFSTHVMAWCEDEASHGVLLEEALRYAAWACLTCDGRQEHRESALFWHPHRLDFSHLVALEASMVNGTSMRQGVAAHRRQREGFGLTDEGMTLEKALSHAHYCIYCHKQGKDSCSKGFRDVRDGSGFRQNVFGEPLTGCPLGEKISEMNMLKGQGLVIGALAMVVVDNPMVAGTGHRICNDCMKACIYQKQEPVDIPQVETRVLRDVLSLPWGFEIYSVLTRWNPLNVGRPYARPYSGRHVLVVGLGPAGYTLAHHLANDGHGVVVVDGLKLEPLPASLCGVDSAGVHGAFEPIEDITSLYEPLESRIGAGFGGVAEYGITVRWNKNFLLVLRLLLERRRHVALFGGVRFGSTLSMADAWDLGFDHIALCAGAGKPTVIDMPNKLAFGVRQASDFLMALQLTGAAREDSLSNLQLSLPVVVIGGGLTAVDTATEAMAYYGVQVKRFWRRFRVLCDEGVVGGMEALFAEGYERETARVWLEHGRILCEEEARAREEGRDVDIKTWIDTWGGVSMVYRRSLAEAPSYRLNHEEVRKAVEEGIHILDHHVPLAVEVDKDGHACGLRVKGADGEERVLKARSILVAAGTKPNVVLAREEQGLFSLEERGFFQALSLDGKKVSPQGHAKPNKVYVMASIDDEGRGISFFGDLHPSYAGNVVRAMASAKQGYGEITTLMAQKRLGARHDWSVWQSLCARLNSLWRVRVVSVEVLAPKIVEVVLEARAAATHFRPGQFFRFQNYESHAMRRRGTCLGMEGLALTGAWVDKEKGLLSTIVLEMGGSSDLCRFLRPHEPVVLMGPTGSPTELAGGESVLLVGGGLGNAVLFSIGEGLRQQGSKVLYFAGYRRMHDRYKVDVIERAADKIVWCCDEGPGFEAGRPQDLSYVGNIVEALHAYGEGRLAGQGGESSGEMMPLSEVDRVIVIGSDGMMAAVKQARHGVLKPYMKASHVAIGSINSPMQCMMKEICAQCLQVHRDSKTGKEDIVYSCFNQDQPLDKVDFTCLHGRLEQNKVQETLTKAWLRYCLPSP